MRTDCETGISTLSPMPGGETRLLGNELLERLGLGRQPSASGSKKRDWYRNGVDAMIGDVLLAKHYVRPVAAVARSIVFCFEPLCRAEWVRTGYVLPAGSFQPFLIRCQNMGISDSPACGGGMPTRQRCARLPAWVPALECGYSRAQRHVGRDVVDESDEERGNQERVNFQAWQCSFLTGVSSADCGSTGPIAGSSRAKRRASLSRNSATSVRSIRERWA